MGEGESEREKKKKKKKREWEKMRSIADSPQQISNPPTSSCHRTYPTYTYQGEHLPLCLLEEREEVYT